jgi:hypothetical protein
MLYIEIFAFRNAIMVKLIHMIIVITIPADNLGISFTSLFFTLFSSYFFLFIIFNNGKYI